MSAGARTGPAGDFREEFVCFGGTLTASSEEESVSEEEVDDGVRAGGWAGLGFFLEADDDDETMTDDDALVVLSPGAFSSTLLLPVSDEGAFCLLAGAVVVFLDF